jgi:hypothetical protein
MLLNKNSKLIKQTKPLKMVGIIMSNWNFTIGVNTMHLAISNATITKNIEQAKRIEVAKRSMCNFSLVRLMKHGLLVNKLRAPKNHCNSKVEGLQAVEHPNTFVVQYFLVHSHNHLYSLLAVATMRQK